MNNSQERAGYSDEISLVDLAATFVRRRRVFYATFIFVTLAGVLYALFQTDKYEYVTLLESAEKSGDEFIEKPASTVAILQNRWIPGAISSYQAEHSKLLPFKLEASNPENTGLIRISSETNVENAGLVKSTHQMLAKNVIERQQQLLQTQQKSLKKQIASMDQVIQSLQSSGARESSGNALGSAIQKRAELESELGALQPANVVVISRQSTDQKGTSSILLVILAGMLGGMLGVFLAFFADFVTQVRESLAVTTED